MASDLTNYVRLDYCQYGTAYRKRTRIAHSDNIQWAPRPLCDPKICSQVINGRHVLTAQQGPGKKGGVRDRQDTCSLDMLHGLPRELTEEILKVCESHQWELT